MTDKFEIELGYKCFTHDEVNDQYIEGFLSPKTKTTTSYVQYEEHLELKLKHDSVKNELRSCKLKNAALKMALDQALRQWDAYASHSEESDLSIADNPEAQLFRDLKRILEEKPV